MLVKGVKMRSQMLVARAEFRPLKLGLRKIGLKSGTDIRKGRVV